MCSRHASYDANPADFQSATGLGRGAQYRGRIVGIGGSGANSFSRFLRVRDCRTSRMAGVGSRLGIGMGSNTSFAIAPVDGHRSPFAFS